MQIIRKHLSAITKEILVNKFPFKAEAERPEKLNSWKFYVYANRGKRSIQGKLNFTRAHLTKTATSVNFSLLVGESANCNVCPRHIKKALRVSLVSPNFFRDSGNLKEEKNQKTLTKAFYRAEMWDVWWETGPSNGAKNSHEVGVVLKAVIKGPKHVEETEVRMIALQCICWQEDPLRVVAVSKLSFSKPKGLARSFWVFRLHHWSYRLFNRIRFNLKLSIFDIRWSEIFQIQLGGDEIEVFGADPSSFDQSPSHYNYFW